MKTPTHYLIFDVESVGLHGEGFAVAGGIYLTNGLRVSEFAYHCPHEAADGSADDRAWINANVTSHPGSVEFENPLMVRQAFWGQWTTFKKAFQDGVMAVECGWPVEAKFLESCIADDPSNRNWEGPYPLHEIASFMLAAGLDPMATYKRQNEEQPAHEPLADSRLSARLLFEALDRTVRAGDSM